MIKGSSMGIVLRTRTFGEDDVLVEILTPGEGRFHAFARHGRKSRKRFGTVLEPFNLISVQYQEKGGFISLSEAVLEIPLSFLAQDFERLMAAFYLVEVVREFIPERHPDRRLYGLLKESLESLNSGLPPREALETFESSFLDLQGYRPVLRGCLACGKDWRPDETFYFLFREGGIACAGCLPRDAVFVPYSPSSLAPLLSRFLEYQLGHPLRSSRFLSVLQEGR